VVAGTTMPRTAVVLIVTTIALIIATTITAFVCSAAQK